MTVVAAVVSTSAVAQPSYPSWTRGTLPVVSKRSLRRSFFNGRSSSFRRRKLPPRAALVEATPSSVIPTLRDGSSSAKVLALPADRANDLQAEARAMARSVNASVYSPQLLADKYGSRPFKVLYRGKPYCGR